MSRRNPMNERYQSDEKTTGKTRKSAASAKPVMKAASSVYIQDPNNKQKEGFLQRMFGGGDKKREEDAKARAKASVSAGSDTQDTKATKEKHTGKYTLLEMEGDSSKEFEGLSKEDKKALRQKYNNPGTNEYKKWRRIWWVVIILGICSLIPPIAFPNEFVYNETRTMVFYVLGWGFLLAAVGIDALKIRPLRKKARGDAALDRSKQATKARKAARQEQIKKEEEAARKRAEKQARKEARKSK